MATIPTLEELKRFDTSHDLILSLTVNEEIIQFNKESERFTGFSREEVLHKKLSEVLIPKESTSLWKHLLDSIQHDLWIDNSVLPIRTKDDRIHRITWTGFLVKDEHGSVKDICIFGKPVESPPIEQPKSVLPTPVKQSKDVVQERIEPPKDVLPTPTEPSERVLPKLVEGSEGVVPMRIKLPGGVLPKSVDGSEGVVPKRIEAPKDVPPKLIIQEKEPEMPHVIPIFSSPTPSSPLSQPVAQDVSVKHGVNKIIFAREKKFPSEQTSPKEERKIAPLVVPVEPPAGVPTQKLELLHDSLSDLLEKYETVCKRVAELEKNDQQSEKKQDHKETPLPQLREKPRDEPNLSTKIHKEVDANIVDVHEHDGEEDKSSFFPDPFGFKRQHAELILKQQQIELRSKELNAFEARLLRQEHVLDARIEEFSKWQEKLMLLESAIENRRQELMKQENFDLGKEPVPMVMNRIRLSEPNAQKASSSEFTSSNEETLEKIPQSAAIVQRGIVKQVNTPFLNLFGYCLEEILEKSYFDFIALEGLADVEKYYLDRLKGESASIYKTVFSTKSNSKIPAEVSIKQTIYNGEKAEITIITTLNTPSL